MNLLNKDLVNKKFSKLNCFNEDTLFQSPQLQRRLKHSLNNCFEKYVQTIIWYVKTRTISSQGFGDGIKE